ncbi:hypothetical protein MTO96_028475 [Rhipicephalus appendiculatus]
MQNNALYKCGESDDGSHVPSVRRIRSLNPGVGSAPFCLRCACNVWRLPSQQSHSDTTTTKDMFFPSRSSRDNMWHEARKQERKIRGMLVDLKKRAERRKEFYERIKQDPAQFLQLHGRRCKIHIDLAIAQAADSPATMMPWQGNRDVMIDRFDVRAHLDAIPEFKTSDEGPELTEEQKEEERQINYERYRTLVQNDFLGGKHSSFV